MTQISKRAFKAGVIKSNGAQYVEPKDSVRPSDKDGDEINVRHEARVKRMEQQEQIRKDNLKSIDAFQSLEDKVAKSAVYLMFHCVDKLKKYFDENPKFKFRPNLYHVDKFYEFAYIENPNGTRVKAPLYLDLPLTEYAITDAKEKQIACKKLGLRYAYILPGDRLDVLLDRLGEL